MKQRLYPISVSVSIFLLATLACNLQAGAQPAVSTPPEPGNVQLSVMQTLTAVAISNPPQQPIPAFTASMSLPPPASISPTTSVILITVSMDTNCRTGPGKVYDYLGALLAGEQTEVTGWDGAGEYWYVKNPDRPGGFCWLWGHYATVTGNTSTLPVFTPQPTPGPVPAFAFSYTKWGVGPGYQCLLFDVENTGGLTWESYSLSVHDTTHGDTGTTSGNEFTAYDQWCTNTGSLSNLTAGETGTASVITYMTHNPAEDHFNATLTLCSANGLAGQCLTQSISFTF
ncbi:MAG: hypothetical protein ACOYYU_05205 [Chloroflexota bacterium]